MLIIFDMRDDQITPEQTQMLVEASPLWILCTQWRIVGMEHLDEMPQETETQEE